MKKLIKRLYEYFYSAEIKEEKILKSCMVTDILYVDSKLMELRFDNKDNAEIFEYLGERYHLVRNEIIHHLVDEQIKEYNDEPNQIEEK